MLFHNHIHYNQDNQHPGMIFVQNISVKTVMSAKDLMKTFNLGSSNRHVASTKMNAESSRSHLVISVVMETTNNATGAVLRGKVGITKQSYISILYLKTGLLFVWL